MVGGEGAHDEGVVAVLALEAQVRLVRVDLEGVVADAAVDHRRDGDAARKVATEGQLGGLEGVLGEQAVGHVARGREDLADLEDVVALAAIDGHQRGVVVHRKAVVALAAFDDDAPVDAHVVVDPLDGGVGERAVGVRVGERHEVAAHQELVGGVRAEDGQRVDAAVRVAGIGHVDAVGRRSGQLDADRVGVLAAVDVERVGADAGLAGQVGQTIDVDRIRAAFAEDLRVAGDGDRREVEGVGALAEVDRRRGGLHPAAQGEAVAAAEAGHRQRRGRDRGAEQRHGVVARAEVERDVGRLDRRGLDDGAAVDGRIGDGVGIGAGGQVEVGPGRVAAGEAYAVRAVAERHRDPAGLEIDGIRHCRADETVVGQGVEAGPGGEREGVRDPVLAGKGCGVCTVAEADRDGFRLDIGLCRRAVDDAQVGQRVGAAGAGDREGVRDPVGAGQGQGVVAGTRFHGHRAGGVAALQVDGVVARAGADRERVGDGVAAREQQGVVAAARVEGEAAGLDAAGQGDGVVGVAGGEFQSVGDVVAAGQARNVGAVAEVDRQRAGPDFGPSRHAADRAGIGQDVDARSAADLEHVSDLVGAGQREIVPPCGGAGIDRQRIGNVAALQVDLIGRPVGLDAHRAGRIGAGELDRVVPRRAAQGVDRHRTAARDGAFSDVGCGTFGGDRALARREAAVQQDLAALGAAGDRDRGTDEGALQVDGRGGIVGCRMGIPVPVGAQGDGALRLHDGRGLDDEIVAGIQLDRALGREDGDARLHGEVVVGPGRLLTGFHEDGALGDHVLRHFHRARRADAELAAGLHADSGVGVNPADAQAADVPQPEVAARRALDAAERADIGADHLGDEAPALGADAARGDEIGLARGQVGLRVELVRVEVLAGAVQDAAGRRGDEGDVARIRADGVEIEVARGLHDGDVVRRGPQRHDAVGGAVDVAVDLEFVAERVAQAADAILGVEIDRVAADVGPARAGDRRGVDVGRVGEITPVNDRRGGLQHHVALRGDRHHLHGALRLAQHDVAGGAGANRAPELHLDRVGLGADRTRSLQVGVVGDDLVRVRTDAVEDAARGRDEGNVAARREGGFEVQVSGALGDVDALVGAHGDGVRGSEIGADRLRRASDAALAAFEQGIAALDVDRVRRAAADEAGIGLEPDFLGARRLDEADGQRSREGGNVDVDLAAGRDVERNNRLVQRDRFALLDQNLGDLREGVVGIGLRLEDDQVAAALGLQSSVRLEDEARVGSRLDGEALLRTRRVGGLHAEGASDADAHAVLEAVCGEGVGGIGEHAVDDGDAGTGRGTHADVDGRDHAGGLLTVRRARVEDLADLEADYPAADRRDLIDVRGDGRGVPGLAGDVELVAHSVGRVPAPAAARQDALLGGRVVAERNVDARRSRLQQVDRGDGAGARRLAVHGDADAEA
ncbi:hypothetical protein HPGCJGGD_3740 [Methylobacterium haplocladii]|nr:hypothetical protein HPGCJGGD_3740 [Methylobacterium haplocladii]